MRHINLTQYKSFLLFVLLQLPILAIAKDFYVAGKVADAYDYKALIGMHVTLMRTDSTIVSEGVTYNRLTPPVSEFRLPVKENGNYILKFSMIGYQTTYADISVKKDGRRDNVDVGLFYIHEQVYKLKGATVKATKIKMVMKGDTLIYNADAFLLAKGSMLDALIEQLPGVSLKENGRIYVNGRFVEELMLNGKRFFKGDPNVALQNLPAYMVSKVKVYDKAGDLSEFMGKDMNDRSYVIDVHLKKQYSVGWVANAEIGGGTDDRYTGKLFGLQFTPVSQLAAYTNLNNLNSDQKPGATGVWKSQNVGDGLQTTRTGGLSYQYQKGNFSEKYILFSTENQVKQYETDSEANSSTVNFLPQGDTYMRSQNKSLNKSFYVNSANTFMFVPNRRHWWSMGLNVSYRKQDNQSLSRSGVFDTDPNLLIDSQVLDSLFSPNMGEAFRNIITYRQERQYKNKAETFNLEANAGLVLKIKGDPLFFGGNFHYNNESYDAFNRYKIDYLSNQSQPSNYQYQYIERPQKEYQYQLDARYDYTLLDNRTTKKGWVMLKPYYAFQDAYFSDRNSLYRLDQLSGWNSEPTFGTLPSTHEAMQEMIDNSNSYRLTGGRTTTHEARVELTLGSLAKGEYILSGAIKGGGTFAKRTADYYRNNRYHAIHRNDFIPEAEIKFSAYTENWSKDIGFSYRMYAKTPGLLNLIDVKDDSDPLNVSYGNSELKNSYKHTLEVHYKNFWEKRQAVLNTSLSYNYIQNAMAMGYTYDRSTGVRTIMPENINGNYDIEGSLDFSIPLDKLRRLTLSSSTSANYNHSVDLIGVTDETGNRRSTVNNIYLKETLGLNYQIGGKLKLGLKGGGYFTRATSEREDFSTINAGDINYGLTAVVELPYDMQFSTDLTQYSRRGYEDSAMNTNELVWNARLAKSFLNGNLTFMLDGFDILGNLSNVRRTINAQGKTETYYNVIPRYAMLRAVYRLNIQPKKRNKGNP